ncbi:winged helix-turn-helix domain-containing protein [Rossellomorea aquimaris]|uniref:ArsR/SmtB family transcription factor n=1 Tax=Rossellomorea aquimaris TaxID=189382 RepID=UPI001CD51D44|nr:winged helix-turn-helix domain-containing protein [Rossellomorea aquimaris]MCA1054095.1 winged helix-turn-helix domain-containing protein [Rossellomorea aquimaris]
MKNNSSINISMEQQKLISNATRIKIIHLLKQEELTAMEVATRLGKSVGSVHYHIQLLHKGGILELVKEKKKGGIIEKYYKSKATKFVMEDKTSDVSSSVSTNLTLNQEEKQQFLLELEQLFVRWESQMTYSENKKEYKVTCAFQEVQDS